MTGSLVVGAAGCTAIHADVAAALAAWAHHAPGPAARAWRALEHFSSAGRAPRTAPEWCGSRLTGDGYPLELVFTFGSDRLRYTWDPVAAGCRPPDALRHAQPLVGPVAPSAAACLQGCAEAQARAALRYGAWIGGSHDGSNDHYKIYVELPAVGGSPVEPQADGAEAPGVLSRLHAAWPLGEPAATLRMIGVDVASGRRETYWRIRQLETHHVARALGAWGLRERAQELLALVERAYGHPLDGRVPGNPAGLSLATTSAGAPQAATLFVFARTLWGGDANIRRQLRALTAGTAASDAYEDVTAPLSGRDRYQTHHGMLGISVSQDASLRLSIGVRPPPVSGTADHVPTGPTQR